MHEEMCCETDEQADASARPTETTPSQTSTLREVCLRNVLPCNLRTGYAFLSSEYRARWHTTAIANFARCYGFLMYDRDKKVQLLRARCAPSDSATRELIDALDGCRYVDHMRDCIRELLERTDALLQHGHRFIEQQPDAVRQQLKFAVVDPLDGEKEDANREDAEQHQQRYEEIMVTDVLRLARDSLHDIYECMSEREFLHGVIVANDFARHVVTAHDARSGAIEACESVWTTDVSQQQQQQRPPYHCTAFDDAFSTILRDCVVTTALQTHTVALVSLRIALLVVLLVEQILAGDSAQLHVVVTPDEKRQLSRRSANDEYARLATEYMTNTFSPDSLLATVAVYVFRSYLANCCEWPLKLREADGRTLSLANFSANLINLLQARPQQHNGARSWLTARRGPTAIGGRGRRVWRLYANFEVLLNMFERISLSSVDASVTRGKRGRDAATTTTTTTTPMTTTTPTTTTTTTTPIRAKVYDASLKLQYEDHSLLQEQCRDVLISCLRSADGRGLREFAITRLVALDPTLRVEQNGVGVGTQLEEVLGNVASTVTHLFLYSMVSCVRHDAQAARDTFVDLNAYRVDNGSIEPLAYHEYNDAFVLMKLHAMMQIQRTRVTSAKLDKLLRRATHMWNDRLGVCDLQQLSETLMCLVDFLHLGSVTRL